MEEIAKQWVRWIAIVIFAIIFITIYKFLDGFLHVREIFNNFMKIISPFLIGILISYLLYIPCKGVEKLYNKSKIKFIEKKSRVLSVFSIYLLFVLIIAIFIKFAIPVLYTGVVDLIDNVPTYYTNIVESVENIPKDSILNNINIKEGLIDFSNKYIEEYVNIENILKYVEGMMSFFNIIFKIGIGIVFSIYILIERRNIVKFLDKLSKALFKKNTYENIKKYFISANEIFLKFIAGKVLDGIIVMIVVTTILSILDVKYALVLGIMSGIFNLIPYFGTIAACIIIVFITIFTGGVTEAITVLILLLITQQIDGNIIEPRIMKSALEISPILVIAGVMVGGAYFGMPGMFLAVPVVTIIKMLLIDYIEFKQKEKIKQGDEKDI